MFCSANVESVPFSLFVGEVQEKNHSRGPEQYQYKRVHVLQIIAQIREAAAIALLFAL